MPIEQQINKDVISHSSKDPLGLLSPLVLDELQSFQILSDLLRIWHVDFLPANDNFCAPKLFPFA